ncbi:MAG: peptidoglycan-binding protein [Candidatus Doudnabacteria bacterium]|nr:peptidoglycan-binding protein [Candidatus Doudnabacteria bacterium]
MIISKKILFGFISFIAIIAALPARAQLMMPNFNNDGIQQQVENFFIGAPEMINIAKCESGFRQYNNNGEVLAGGNAGNYLGVFQISKGHTDKALALGWDIYTTDGNLAYAKYLYQQQGTSPWAGCVSVTPSAIPSFSAATLAPAVAGSITQNLKLGAVSPEVKTLQQILNALGFTIAKSGPGSSGQETEKFGSLTKQAVQQFQCQKNITCSGNEATTGYGRVGPYTRAAILDALSAKQ